MTKHSCEFCGGLDCMLPCGKSASFKIVWALWPLLPSDPFDEDGRLVPRAVWLCSKHHDDWAIYMGLISSDRQENCPKQPRHLI